MTLSEELDEQLQDIIGSFEDMEATIGSVQGVFDDFKNNLGMGLSILQVGFEGLQNTLNLISGFVAEAAQGQQGVIETKQILTGGALEQNMPELDGIMKNLDVAVREVSEDLMYGGEDIRAAMNVLLENGFTDKEITGDGNSKQSALDAVGRFGQVNGIDAVDAAQQLSPFLDGFGMSIGEFQQGIDLLVRYQGPSGMESESMAQIMGSVSEKANIAWQGRDKVAAAEDTIQLAIMTNSLGLDDAASAASMNEFLSGSAALIKDMSTESIEAFKSMGLVTEVTDKSGNVTLKNQMVDDSGMLKSIGELESMLEGAAGKFGSMEEFQKTAQTALGTQGAMAATALGAVGDDIPSAASLGLAASGQAGADAMVGQSMGTVGAQEGQLEKAKAGLSASMGTPFLEETAQSTQVLSDVIFSFSDLISDNGDLVKFFGTIAGGGASILAVTGVILTLISGLKALPDAMGKMNDLKLIGSLKTFLAPSLPVLAIATAAVLVFAGLAAVVMRNWDVIGPKFESIMGKISKIISLLVEGIKNFASKFAPVGDVIEKYIVKGIMLAGSVVESVLDVIINLLSGDFSGIFEKVGAVMVKIWEVTKPSALTVVSIFKLVVATLIEMVKWSSENLLPGIQKAMAWIGANVLPVIASIVSWILQNAVPSIGAMIEVIIKIVKKLVSIGADMAQMIVGVIKSIGEKVQPTIGLMKNLISGMVDGIKGIIDWVVSNIFPLVEAAVVSGVAVLAKFKEGWNSFKDKVVEVAQIMWEKLQPAFEIIGKVVKKVVDTIIKIVKKLVGIYISIAKTVIGVVMSIAEKAKPAIEVMGKIISKVVEVIRGIIDWVVVNIFPVVAAAIESGLVVLGRLKEGWIAFKDKVVEVVQMIWEKVQPAFDKVKEVILVVAEKVQDLIGFLGQLAKDGFDKLKEMLSPVIDMLEKVWGWIGDVKDKLADLLGFKKDNETEFNKPYEVNGPEPKPVVKEEKPKGLQAPELIGNWSPSFVMDYAYRALGIDPEEKKPVEIVPQDPQTLANIGLKMVSNIGNGIKGEKGQQSMQNAIDSVKTSIEGGLTTAEEMRQYGANLIQAWIDGMNSKTNLLREAMNAIALVSANFIKVESPTKEGPLHTNQLWGGNLIKSFAGGMNSESYRLSLAANQAAYRLLPLSQGGPMPTISGGGSAANNAPITIVINGADKNETEIAKTVARELEKHGIGKRKMMPNPSLCMSPYGYRMGY